ncbi:DUF2905 domain-containing protein [Melghirimyces algeriensis]|uniref:DUF2905 domain-containing protein n=1 Tax=Melghirimyces algeriensis TaxID=910412 RepID=A0A521AUG9_9BACL|nr:DUF2905 domain-containing protein [Melghirimyces algeriensis]SMO38457.1 Protein of unknown function [Melghirimyces algeriensis]
MNLFPKTLIFLGVTLVVVGLIWHLGGRFFNLGRLPGDIVIKKENISFYFPIVSSIVISLVLSFLLYLFRLFR